MSEAAEKCIAELEKDVRVAQEMLALVLNETGPVEIDKKNHNPVKAGSEIMVDINNETGTVVLSLVAPNAEQ